MNRGFCLPRYEQYPEGRTVITEGDMGDRFYVIVRGQVEVVRDVRSAQEARLAVLQDGDYFGEISLLRDVVRNATVRTLTPCTFLTLTQELFHRLLADAPEIKANLEASAHARQ